MFGVASRLYVQVGVVAGCALRLHGIVPVVRGQLLNLIVDILTYEVALFHPSHCAGRGAHFDEAAIVVEDFDAFSIFYHTGFFVDRGHVVAEDGLDSGNVGDLENASAAAVACGEKDEAEDCRQEAVAEMFHGVAIQYSARAASSNKNPQMDGTVESHFSKSARSGAPRGCSVFVTYANTAMSLDIGAVADQLVAVDLIGYDAQ
jgi:hypothetical protein